MRIGSATTSVAKSLWGYRRTNLSKSSVRCGRPFMLQIQSHPDVLQRFAWLRLFLELMNFCLFRSRLGRN
jgi:hypothetical protein